MGVDPWAAQGASSYSLLFYYGAICFLIFIIFKSEPQMRILITNSLFLKQEEEVVELAYFPQEIITDILVQLPVESLLRFRCVSKSLSNLIDSPSFIKLHLNMSPRNRNLIIGGKQLISTNYNSAKLHVSDFDNVPTASRESTEWSFEVYGYCNGLFLLIVNRFHIVLWNPSTHKYRTLPRCTSCPPCIGGLCYDSTLDDYKVVLIATLNKKKMQSRNRHVYIFGLKSNSWRIIETDFFHEKILLIGGFGYFADGDLYWTCMLDLYDYHSQDIFVFDVSKETFSRVAQPLYPTKGWVTSLHLLNGCLCISFLSYPLELAILYIRKKDEADVFKWSILYSLTQAQLPPFLDLYLLDGVKVLGYSKEGDHKIMLDLNFKYMISYDVKEKSFQTINISTDYPVVQSCFESLVSVGDGDLQDTIKKATTLTGKKRSLN